MSCITGTAAMFSVVWCSTSRIADSGIHRYGTRRNHQRAMESLQAEFAEMKIRMNQFMDVVQGVAQGQRELRQMMQRNPATTQPETLIDPPAGEVNGPSGPGPTPILHVTSCQQLIHDDQEDQFPLLQEDFGMSHGMDPIFRRLEERLKAVEGQNPLGVDVVDLGLVPGVRVPPKFKVPIFDKYSGNSCPKTHVQAYFRKMVAYSDDEKLLMYFFHDGLARASLECISIMQTWLQTELNFRICLLKAMSASGNTLNAGGRQLPAFNLLCWRRKWLTYS
ncbi:hypothetical protein KIW84_065063 [Lathyrus oleraceus]|uniref:Uncharacterized protein n=1 Tax=Pisum sativum TaxID=3888 RepID=A0A9D4WDH2_PEA|nr:hypothetical protein KIW84_065063 [Pisum sativum]